jgi:hypothetical protein
MSIDRILQLVAVYTTAFPLLTGYRRFKTMPIEYRLFLFFYTAGFLNEFSITLMRPYYPVNAYINIHSNVYMLISYLLLLYMFKSWGAWSTNQKGFYALMITGVVWWIVEVIFLGRSTLATPAVVMFYFLVFIYLFVDAINRVMAEEKGKLVHNFKFIISVGFISAFSIYSLLPGTEPVE